ncbi:Cupredoxin [Penicillium paradoxum]|uniref:Cupredoxin n=1 Tax=Penicillium paradoxum TaxID=176176 RepID=UPI002547886F|nr:Cupredoxin [Penicillium paradoxum]KAJ5787622.1 Cupredoxin [Penicillium paradoxum]
MLASQLVRPLLAWLALATITAAQDSDLPSPTGSVSDSSSTPTATSSSGPATHTIKVGHKSDPHQFSPTDIKANAGDLVVFEFYPTNHSVVKADYLSPCVPAEEGLFNSEAFEDFNQENGQIIGPPPTWSLRINNTEPTFFYCTAIDSCTKNGMVGAINPNSSQTWNTQYQKALVYPYMLVPGESPPPEGEDSKSNDDSESGSSQESHHSGLSKGAIAGIAVAAVVFVGILIALFFVLGRNRVYSQWMSSEDGRTERTARWALFGHGDQYGNTKSEGGSSAAGAGIKPPRSDITSVSTPDPNFRTFSPGTEVVSGPGSPSAQQGHWSWNEPPQNARSSGPTELAGHPIIWEAPGSIPNR